MTENQRVRMHIYSLRTNFSKITELIFKEINKIPKYKSYINGKSNIRLKKKPFGHNQSQNMDQTFDNNNKNYYNNLIKVI